MNELAANQISVVASPLPFSNKQHRAAAPPGHTIQEIIDDLCPPHLFAAGLAAIVDVNGWNVPQEQWASYQPKLGTLVNVRIVPQKGGGKSPIVSLLSIAVMIAAPYVSTALLSGTLFASASQGILAGRILTAAIGVVGKLLVSALAPPPKPSNTGNASVSNPTESPTQFIEGAQNSLNPFGVVPICLGTNRMFPLQAARPYTETQNNDQYVRQLFTYGYGDKMVISSIRIGETPIEEFNEVEMQHRLEGDLHEPTDLFSNDVFQDDYSILLSQPDGFTTRSTQPDTNEAIVDVTFPQGLCRYSGEGDRNSFRVQLELQYAVSGNSPQDWSPAATGFKAFSGISSVAIPAAQTGEYVNLGGGGEAPAAYTGERTDSVVINKYSGVISILRGQEGAGGALATIPANNIALARVRVQTSTNRTTGTTTNTVTTTDARQPSQFGSVIEDSGDFVTSNTGLAVTVTSGSLAVNDLDITGNQTEALRKSLRILFPGAGQYDIRIRRVTNDAPDDQQFDEVVLTSIKSIKYQAPVNLVGINGTAVRIKGTDQLNGTLDQFNVIASNVIPAYNELQDEWTDQITSNPAALYRYVLQCDANAKALPDDQISITDLEDWHTHCLNEGYTYNRVIDYDTSVDEILRDIAAAGAASPAIVDGKRTVVINRINNDITQIVTPRNSWGYSGEMTYPDLPHAFRVQFRNADKGYIQDERIVYADGYDESNATEFEVLELQSCTNANLAFKTARRHQATVLLQPETHTFMMEAEHLVMLRGDRVILEHDVPIIGIGDGRIKTVSTDGNSPALVTGITIDDSVTVPSDATYYARIRLSDGTFLYKELVTDVGETSSFVFAVPFTIADTPEEGDLCAFFEAGGELDLIVTRIEPGDDLTARITAVNYDPGIFTAENSEIPAFNSRITSPLEFSRPLAPVLLDDQSDENVMLINSDGTRITRAIFTLQNKNDGDISTLVKIRLTGTDVFTNANVLEATPERLVITGLTDAMRYDIHIRYKRAGASQYSLPLQLNNYLFIGTSGTPADVDDFLISVSGNTALFKWAANEDIDHSHYIMKFSGAFSGATWATAQTLEARIYENRLAVPFVGGTYLIKAVDLSGNESENATAIITYNPGVIANAVEQIEEAPAWAGSMDNVVLDDDAIQLDDPDIPTGYYYFDEMVDLTGLFTAFVSAELLAGGAYTNGVGGNDLFAEADIFAMDDIFGIGSEGWEIQLQYSVTLTDPTDSPAGWTDWAEFTAGNLEFWAIKFRLLLTSLAQNITPRVTTATVTVDMPDRIERGEDLTVPNTGTTITYTPAFKTSPAVAITIQDGDANDEIEYVSKDETGFTFKVYNVTALGYVERSYDFIASGYGRKNN